MFRGIMLEAYICHLTGYVTQVLKHFNKQGLNFFFFLLDSKRCENENESLDDQAEEMDKAGFLCKIFCPNREMS